MYGRDNLMIYCIEEKTFSPSYDLAPHPSPISHQQVVSLSQSAYELTDGRGGVWWRRGRSQIMTNNNDNLPIFRFPKMRAAAASLLLLLLRFTQRLNFVSSNKKLTSFLN
jgi:hypothetical protein